MKIPKNLDFNPLKALKITGLALIAIIAFAFIINLFGGQTSSWHMGRTGGTSIFDSDGYISPNMPLDEISSKQEAGEFAYDAQAPVLSARNAGSADDSRLSTGKDAENYETREYFAEIETRDLDQSCTKIRDLKPLEYIIFENANEADNSCSYIFKAEIAHKDEVLAVIEDLSPKDLVENVRTIKNSVEDFTSEMDILKKKQDVIDETLKNAVASYNEISAVATQAKDAESLAKIIDSKIGVIERLSQQRIAVAEQLERLSRSKAEELDKLAYAYFRVNIRENKFVDRESLAQSWKAAIKELVRNVNSALQDISVNLLSAILFAVKIALYLLLALIVAKYFWKAAKHVWNR